eukprot:COSAG02_NODE_1063_length_14846_cov_134.162745_10_plen_79_part_00
MHAVAPGRGAWCVPCMLRAQSHPPRRAAAEVPGCRLSRDCTGALLCIYRQTGQPRSYDILRILAKITARNANISRIKA